MTRRARRAIEERLRVAGLRLTPQRYAILEHLMGSPDHPTADQIGASVNSRFPRASRATVYNTLRSLCDAGLVREVYLEAPAARYDANREPHHHFVCDRCGRLADVPEQGLRGVRAPAIEGGYRVES